MSLIETASMESVKQKLRNLQELSPEFGEGSTLVKFAEYLSDQLKSELGPEGFAFGYSDAITSFSAPYRKESLVRYGSANLHSRDLSRIIQGFSKVADKVSPSKSFADQAKTTFRKFVLEK